jgi:phenylalanyl-tRNA synthetase alpha chain
MQDRKPPVRIIVPGRCYRHEATDATHEANFFQLEGFMIDKNTTFANLIGSLKHFAKEIFGDDIKIRFTPSYYPFVEPGMDMGIWWENGKGKGKWLEILGSGMIHPKVLENMKIDPEIWSGFAFGMGIDRLMMIKTGVNDIRLSYQNDLRFLKQF